jgi:hypothetical protein
MISEPIDRFLGMRTWLSCAVLATIFALPCLGQTKTLFYEGFEGDTSGWVEQDPNGEDTNPRVWEVGRPTRFGPSSAYAGSKCAATEISGYYDAGVDSQWASPPIQLPSFADGTDAWLEFRNWYDYDYGDGDVEILIWDSQAGEWGTGGLVYSVFGQSSGWQHAIITLREYGGERIRVAFNHYGGWDDDPVGPGWYIDEVRVYERGPNSWTDGESFESGLGDWVPMSDLWQAGTPNYGPDSVPFGSACAATNRTGPYPRNSSALLASPSVQIPTPATPGSDVWFSYYEWVDYGFRAAGFTYISLLESERWADSIFLARTSQSDGHWKRSASEVTQWGGERARFAYLHLAENETPAAGWHLDGVEIRVREPGVWDGSPEGFENGLGEWVSEGGAWQTGAPTYGPADVPGGTSCVATRPGGPYLQFVTGRLVSPAIELGTAGNPVDAWLSFDHWYEYEGETEDLGRVEISVFADGAWGAWMPLATLHGQHTDWRHVALDLTGYLGELVRIGFWHEQAVEVPAGTAAGWYLDNIGIRVRDTADWDGQQESFEQGLSAWRATGGWQVGTPAGGPAGGHSGSACAFVDSTDGAPAAGESRLVSPPVTIPADEGGDAWLRFSHWLPAAAAGTAFFEVSFFDGGSWGPWQSPARDQLEATGDQWVTTVLNVTDMAGRTMRFSFRVDGDAAAGGLYVDDVEIRTRAAGSWDGSAEGFESGLGDWLQEGTVWAAGAPTAGPAAPHSGTGLAGTVLDGAYPASSASRLIAPPMSIPETVGAQDIWLTFWQWVDYGAADNGAVQISVFGGGSWGAWQDLGTVDGAGKAWRYAAVEMTAYRGKHVRLAFLHSADGAARAGETGWYIDDVTVAVRAADAWDGSMSSFEAGAGDWRPGGSWRIGGAVSGAGQAWDGSACASLSPCTGCLDGVPQRLVSPPLAVGSLGAGDAWLCFRYWLGTNDAGEVQAEVSAFDQGVWQAWIPVTVLPGSAGAWGAAALDLSPYSGSHVRVAFRALSPTVASQVSVDAVELVYRDAAGWDGAVQEFEAGLGDWVVEGGIWAVGTPAAGPGSAFDGVAAASTVLDGDYPQGYNARLVTPPYAMPEAVRDGEIWLEFAHWYEYADGGGSVEVSTLLNGAWSAWQPVHSGALAAGSSPGWVARGLELGDFLGQTVRFAFRHDGTGAPRATAAGWTVDDVQIVLRPFAHWDGTLVGFEAGLGDWQAGEDNWEAGTPTDGPGGAAEGTQAAFIVGGGAARLISPVIDLSESEAESVHLRFQEWYSAFFGVGRTVKVSIRRESGWSDWLPLGRLSTGLGATAGWRERILDLSPLVGETFRVMFECTDAASRERAWYLDAIEVVEEPPLLWAGTESFEDDLAGWSVEGNAWTVFRLGDDPVGAAGGKQYAAAVSGEGVGIGPHVLGSRPIELPLHDSALTLTFQERYGSGVAALFISVWTGAVWGADELLYAPAAPVAEWTRRVIDITAYAGKRVRFRFSWTAPVITRVDDGWRVDDVAAILNSSGNRVQAAFPAGMYYRATGVVRLLFSADMDTAGNRAGQPVTLTGPAGPIAVTDLAWQGARELLVHFAPQWRPGVYWVQLDDSFMGADGNGLDQNMDGRADGAPADLFAASFCIAPIVGAPWEVTVGSGWSFFSLPVSPAEPVGELFDGVANGPLWAWRSDVMAYEPVDGEDHLAPQVGHWIYSLDGGTVSGAEGIPGAGTVFLRTGWNAVGVAHAAATDALLAAPGSFAWMWEPVRQVYRAFGGGPLTEGQALWLYSPVSGHVDLP